MHKQTLTEIGLTDSESKVYLALIKLGSATTGPLIKQAKINHAKIYLILKKLQDKGLATYIIKNNVKHYQATDPSNLKKYIKSKKQEIEKQEKAVNEIIPQLKLESTFAKDQQQAEVYTGYEGVKAAFNFLLSTLKANEEYYVLTLYGESAAEQLKRFLLNYHQKRIEKKVKVKLLTMKKFKEKVKQTFPIYKYSERRYINHELPTGVFIFKNYVMHFLWSDNPTIFKIASQQNANRYKAFFKELWKKAEK